MEAEAAAAGESLLLQLGVGAAVAILILREVFNFLSKLRDKSKPSDDEKRIELLHMIRARVDELYKWHDVKDEDQVYVWYVRKSLEREIGKLCDAVNKLEQAANRQASAIERLVEVGDE